MTQPNPSLAAIQAAYSATKKRLLLLDYDGTLVPFAPKPDDARPTAQTLKVLRQLTVNNRNTVVVISGRDKATMDRWLGGLPLQLIAEHGVFEKHNGGWRTVRQRIPTDWQPTIQSIMEAYVQAVPGSLLEKKETSLAYHYRGAIHQDQAAKEARKLSKELRHLVSKLDLQFTRDNLTIEVRHQSVSKAQMALINFGRDNYDFVLCAGDSETDEDMFMALGQQAFCIKIGPGKTAANYRLKNSEAFLKFLISLQAAQS